MGPSIVIVDPPVHAKFSVASDLSAENGEFGNGQKTNCELGRSVTSPVHPEPQS
jgi:hypothetical protein